jgi:hypothetical protein
VEDVCNDSEAYCEQKEPSAPGTNDVVCVLVDCKGVVMRKGHIHERERPSDKDLRRLVKRRWRQ